MTRQRKVHRQQARFLRSKALYRAFAGGRGAGKSWVGAYDLLGRALSRRTYMVASPTAVIMGDTTYPTFKALAQEMGLWKSVKLTPYPNAVLSTGATIRFRTAEDPERLRGPNLSGCWLDEASLMTQDAYTICIAALREAGEQGWMTATFTPKGRSHWSYTTFATGRPDTELFHARTGQNPFLPPQFEETLRRQYPEVLARQELAGEFCDLEGEAWQVIPTAWAEEAMRRWRPDGGSRPLECVGVDVARGGADKTVLALRHALWIAPLRKHAGAATPNGPAVVALIVQTISGAPRALVNVDVIGVGASVYDGCVSSLPGVPVMPVNFAEGVDATDATGKLRMANMRAFSYWSLREALDPAGPVRLVLPPDNELLADLTAARWKMTLRGVQIEAKEEVAKRLGRSPDCADAVALACLLPAPSGPAGPSELRV